MMGACLSGDGASEASEDNNLDVESTLGDLEGDWYLDVARQVASTTHPYEVGHDHELELVDDRSTLDQCDWPRGKSKYDARHFLRLY